MKYDANGNPIYKTRLFIQGHTEPDKDLAVNEDPTVLRSSMRLFVALSTILGLPYGLTM